MTDMKDKLIKIQGKEYLQVKDRVKAWRDENPDAQVNTEILMLDLEHEYAAVKASVTLASGAHATGMGSSSKAALSGKASRVPADQYLEMAETRAIGRALARLGYGTEDALDTENPVDSPVAQQQAAPQRQQAARPAIVVPQQQTIEAAAAPMSNLDQHTQIRELAKGAGTTEAEVCTSLNIKALSELTEAKAQRVIERLLTRQPEAQQVTSEAGQQYPPIRQAAGRR